MLVTETLKLDIPKSGSDNARRLLERIGWRGYLPPASGDEPEVRWDLPADQIDLIRSVLRRNRRLAGDSAHVWSMIDCVCETIAEESQRLGVRPDYGFGAGYPGP